MLLCSSGLRAAIASSTNSGPFQQGLTIVFAAAATMAVIAAGASALRGGRYVHEETQGPVGRADADACRTGAASRGPLIGTRRSTSRRHIFGLRRPLRHDLLIVLVPSRVLKTDARGPVSPQDRAPLQPRLAVAT